MFGAYGTETTAPLGRIPVFNLACYASCYIAQRKPDGTYGGHKHIMVTVSDIMAKNSLAKDSTPQHTSTEKEDMDTLT